MTTIVANTFNIISFDWVRTIITTIQKRIERRKTIRQLSALSDRDLNDMGITRGDIYSIANGTFHREYPNTKANRNLDGWV